MDDNTVRYIANLSLEDSIKALKDAKFRKELFQTQNHYPFVWLVQELKDEKLLYLLDDDIVPFLENDSRQADKLNVIITCCNNFNNDFLKNEKVISLIVKNIRDLHYYLDTLNSDFGNNYLNYLLDNNLNINYFGYLNDSVQLEIVSNSNNLNKILEKNIPLSFLSSLGPKTIEYLLNNKYFENAFLSYDINTINIIIEKGVTLPVNIQTNKELIDKYLNIYNINTYNNYYLNVSKNNMYLQQELCKKRKKIYKQQIDNIDLELQIFSEYKKILENDYTNIDSVLLYDVRQIPEEDRLNYLQEATRTRLLEMTIDANYEDLTYNFLKNIEIILNFISEINIDLIPKDRLIIYKKLYNYYNLSINKQIELFNELIIKNDNMALFYDDFKSCYNYACELLHESCLDVSKLSVIDKIDNIPIYKLEGENFKMLVHHTTLRRDSNVCHKYINNAETSSLSLIGDTHLGTFRDPNEQIILGFNNFNTKNIMHMYKSDSFTSHQYRTNRILNIYTPEQLLQNTMGYNEILIKEDKDLIPSYVVAYDEIKPGDIAISKFLGNIPIVIINTSKYQTKKSSIDFDGDKYIDHFEAKFHSNYRR